MFETQLNTTILIYIKSYLLIYIKLYLLKFNNQDFRIWPWDISYSCSYILRVMFCSSYTIIKYFN